MSGCHSCPRCYFYSVIDLRGLGEKHLMNLIEKDLLRTPAIFTNCRLKNLRKFGPYGPKLPQRLSPRLNKKNIDARRILSGIGLSDVGPTVAEQLCLSLGDFNRFEVTKMKFRQFTAWVRRSRSLIDGLTHRRIEIQKLLGQVTLIEAQSKFPLGICFSKNRWCLRVNGLDGSEIAQKVKLKGGKTPSSVTKDLDYLVVGNDGSRSSGKAN